jgi:methyl-accepting chemotaxis protein
MSANNERLGIWHFGISVLRRMRFPVKLGLIAVIVLIPMLVVAFSLVQRQNSDVDFTRTELDGLKVLRPTLRVVTLVQQHRGQSNALLLGDTASKSSLEKTRQELAAAVTEAQQAVSDAQLSQLSGTWSGLAQKLNALASSQGQTAAASFALHNELISDLRHYVYSVGEYSGLLYEPQAAAYLLMDAVVSRTIPLTELIDQLRVAGAGALAGAQASAEFHASIPTRIESLTANLKDWRFGLEVLKRNDETGFGGEAAQDSAEGFARLASVTFSAGSAPAAAQPSKTDSATFYAAGVQAVDALNAAQAQMSDRLQVQLQERLLALQRDRGILLLTVGLVTAFLIYVMFSFYKSFRIDLGRLSYAMRAISEGNMRVVGTVRGKDEIGDVAVLLQIMINNVSGMVAAVGSNAALVAHSGRDLSAGNRDLSDRTEQQAANLEQTSASIQELASTVQQNAATAEEVNHTTAQVRDIAESGAASMVTSVQSVEAIQQSSSRMNEIIGVIDGLAFQTNILALNAAVEAARAGEAGRGFAVVASEVRSLAQRSAESAHEIRALIKASSSQVETSVKQIRAAGEGMTQMLNGIRGVSTSISQISTASVEQSNSLREISTAIKQLDEITQRNGQMVERAVSQSGGLEHRAASLADAIRSFKLRQGLAEEAVQLVHRAEDIRERCGSRDGLLRAINDPSNQLFDRDMYVFALDRRGAYQGFGGNAAKIGTLVQDIAGVDGQALLDDIFAQAELAPGWVEYDIVNPVTGKVQSKLSYVMAVDDLAVGCGVYKDLVSH